MLNFLAWPSDRSFFSLNNLGNLKRRIKSLPRFSILMFAVFLVACGPSDGGGSNTTDTDGDGITDVDEATFGTSPTVKDSDGDGFSDFKEITEFGFNPDNNNFRFNPLIADVPKFRVEITSVPEVTLFYETTDDESKVVSTDRSTESANTVTTSDTSSNSRSVEETHSVGASVTVDVSIGGGVEGTVSYDYSHATTSESGFSNTAEQSKENRQALSRGEAFESGSSLTTSGGTLAVSLRILNDGDAAFKVESLVLGSVMTDGSANGKVSPIANLNFDTTFNSFSSFTLAAKQSTGDLVFNNSSLDLETAKRLLRDSSGLIVAVASSEIVDETGVAFAFRQDAIVANTASVILDFGGNRPSERYLVATNTSASNGRVKVKQAFENILKVPYQIDTNGSLESLRSITASADVNSFWLSLLVTTDGVDTTATTFDSDAGGYDFNNLSLKAGDVLHLMYVEDSDFDDLGLRAEFFAGTDPNDPDTDNDGLKDGEEVAGLNLTVDFGQGAGPETKKISSDPLTADGDNDGLTDFEERGTGVWATNPNESDTDFDLNPDAHDVEPTTFASVELRALQLVSNGAGSPSPVLSFKLPRLAIDIRNFVTYDVYRQVVPLGDDFTDFDLATATTCVTDTNCFRKILSGDNVDLSSNPIEFADTAVAGINKDYSYLVLLTVNGSDPFIVANPTMNTAQDVINVTVELKGFTAYQCVDSVSDVECEYFWDFSVTTLEGSETLNLREEVDAISVTDGTNISLAAENVELADRSVTFNVPDLTNSCFLITGVLYEQQSTSVFNTNGDRRLSRFAPFCVADRADWESPQKLNFFNFTAGAGPNGFSYITSLESFYSITIN